MVSSSTELRATESRTAETRDSVLVAEKDTLKEVTVITIDRNEVGDTVRVSTVTDRERVRNRDRVAKLETKIEVRVDTVYVERRDSVAVITAASASSVTRASPWVSALKWVFWIIVSVTVFIIVLKVTRVFNLF